MKSEATIRLQVSDPETLLAALIDDPGTVHAEVDGKFLVLRAESETLLGLLRSLDDVLDCIRATQ